MDADEGTKLLTNPAPGALQLKVFCDAAAACRHSSALMVLIKRSLAIVPSLDNHSLHLISICWHDAPGPGRLR